MLRFGLKLKTVLLAAEDGPSAPTDITLSSLTVENPGDVTFVFGELGAVGGTAPYTFEEVSQSPAGAVSLNVAVSGTNATARDFAENGYAGAITWRVRVTDANGLTLEKEFVVTVTVTAPSWGGVTLDNTAPTVGDVVTATAVASGATSFAYQWKADGADISGETGASHTCTRAGAMGKALSCAVVASGPGGTSAPMESAGTAAVTGAPVCTVDPVASPNPVMKGYTASTDNGTWTGYPAPTFTYQWTGNASGSLGTGSTQTALEMDNSMSCTVTATNVVSAVSAASNGISVVDPF